MSTSPFTIDRITLREIRLDLVEPFHISSGEMTDRRIMLVEIQDTDGVIAWGECVAFDTPNYLPETIDTAWLMIAQHVAPRVLGKTFATPGEVHPALEKNFRGHNMAKAAIEMTCYALVAEKEGISLSKLLGGTRTEISSGVSLGIQESPTVLIEKVQRSLEEGYAKVKMKIQPGADLEYIQAVYDAVGENAHLMVDANNAYTLSDLDHLLKFDDFGLMMIEQPLAWDDFIRHAQLQKKMKTPVCLDESIASIEHAENMVDLDSGRIINIKPGRVGGFHQSVLIHDFCEKNNIPVWCGGMLESGIGRAHNVALASKSNFTLPGDLSPSRRYWAQDIVSPEWDMNKNGMVQVPTEKSGLGIDIDTERIGTLAVRKQVIR